MDGIGERRGQGVCHQRALAAAGDARDHGERAQLHLGGDALEVVGRGPHHLDGAAPRVAALCRQLYLAQSGEVGARDGVRVGGDLFRRAGGHHVPAQLARARAHVYDVVRRADGVLVVLDHDDGVALVPQALEGGDEAVVVALVQADGGLVQDVEHAHEAGADLRGQADALRLSAGEGGRGAGQREVVKAHVDQEAQARADLLDDGPGNDQLALLEPELFKELQALPA